MSDTTTALEPAEPLDAREELFAQEWVYGQHCGVGNKCAEMAGYNGNAATLSCRAWELRRRPRIAARIAEMTADKERLVKTQFMRTADELYGMAVANLADAFDNEGNLLTFDKMPIDLQRAIKSVKTNELWEGKGEDRRQVGVVREVTLHDKKGAAETFLKFADKLADKVKLEPGETVADLFLAAQRMAEAKKKQGG